MDSPESIVDRLRTTPGVLQKVDIAGLTRKPFTGGETKEACGNCIYFLANHQFCDMPELQFPVEPDWWCRLWRV